MNKLTCPKCNQEVLTKEYFWASYSYKKLWKIFCSDCHLGTSEWDAQHKAEFAFKNRKLDYNPEFYKDNKDKNMPL